MKPSVTGAQKKRQESENSDSDSDEDSDDVSALDCACCLICYGLLLPISHSYALLLC